MQREEKTSTLNSFNRQNHTVFLFFTRKSKCKSLKTITKRLILQERHFNVVFRNRWCGYNWRFIIRRTGSIFANDASGSAVVDVNRADSPSIDFLADAYASGTHYDFGGRRGRQSRANYWRAKDDDEAKVCFSAQASQVYGAFGTCLLLRVLYQSGTGEFPLR